MPKNVSKCWQCGEPEIADNPWVDACPAAPRGCNFRHLHKNPTGIAKKGCLTRHLEQCVFARAMAAELQEVVGRLDLGEVSFAGKRLTLDVQKLTPEIQGLLKFASESIVAQRVAIKKMVNAYCRVVGDLNDDTKPLYKGLFLGPTGVGKTKLVEQLARYLYGNEMKGLVRINCGGDFKQYSLQILEADPDTFQNEDRFGNNITILLLDEWEKSSPSMRKIMLEIFDTGGYNTREGLYIDFSRTMIFMTSNLGGPEVAEKVVGMDEITPELFMEMQEICLDATKAEFNPEFFGRLNEVIMFHPLTAAQMEDVVVLEFVLLEERFHKLKAFIRIQVENAVLKKLIKDGYDIRYGARPLKNIIESEIVSPLAVCRASGQLKKHDRVIISTTGKGKNEKYVFEKVLDVEEDEQLALAAPPAPRRMASR